MASLNALNDGNISKSQKPMPLTPIRNSFLDAWLKKQKAPGDPAKPKPRVRHATYQNPKWNDDAGFEKRHGDPDYYTRVKGLG
jgi:hypothetical protein